jgi:hypothetical protein
MRPHKTTGNEGSHPHTSEHPTDMIEKTTDMIEKTMHGSKKEQPPGPQNSAQSTWKGVAPTAILNVGK